MQVNYAVDNFSCSTKPKNQNKKDGKYLTLMSVNELLQGRQMLISAFKSRILPIRNVNIDDY